MDGRRESFLVPAADSSGYEVGEIQILFTFQSECVLQNSDNSLTTLRIRENYENLQNRLVDIPFTPWHSVQQ
jgi:hypothetical protein